MSHRLELTQSEKEEIDHYAKKCASQYGKGIHLMRTIAAEFNDTDYRIYDVECRESEGDYKNYNTEKRGLIADVKIVPNPNNGNFIIKNINIDNTKSISLYNLDGLQIYRQVDITNPELSIALDMSTGLYILKIINFNGTITSKKIIVTQ